MTIVCVAGLPGTVLAFVVLQKRHEMHADAMARDAAKQMMLPKIPPHSNSWWDRESRVFLTKPIGFPGKLQPFLDPGGVALIYNSVVTSSEWAKLALLMLGNL